MKVGSGAEEKEKWCPFAYEFLSDFCYTCGHVGHIDKVCDIRMEKGEPQPFSRSLRYIPEKKKGESTEAGRSWSTKPLGPWTRGGSSSKNSFDSRGDRWGSSGSGSDALT